MGPYRGVAQDGSEGVCPWCQRTLRFEAGADTVVCGCGARSSVALVRAPQPALPRRRRKPRSNGSSVSPWELVVLLIDIVTELL